MLVDYAKQWHRLWSIRLLILSLVLDGASFYFQFLDDLFNAKLFFALGMFLTVAAGIARFVAQPKVHARISKDS